MARRTQAGGGLPPLKWVAGAVTYLAAGSFRVAGNVTSTVAPGLVVYVPGGGWSSVQKAYYDGSTYTNVFLSDAVCFSGMASVGYIAPVAALGASICTGGTVLYDSGASGVPTANIVNGTNWAGPNNYATGNYLSSTTVNGTAYVGYDFGSAVSPRWFLFDQHCYHGNYVTSVLWQYSDNGSSWTTQSTHSGLKNEHIHHIITTRPAAAHRYWRILANSTIVVPFGASAQWAICQMQMGV